MLIAPLELWTSALFLNWTPPVLKLPPAGLLSMPAPVIELAPALVVTRPRSLSTPCDKPPPDVLLALSVTLPSPVVVMPKERGVVLPTEIEPPAVTPMLPEAALMFASWTVMFP